MIVGILLGGIGVLLLLIGIVLQIVLLVKLFKNGGVGLGILGLLCGPFTYIWGWVKSSELGMKKLMVWLTFTIIGAAALFVAAMAAFNDSPEGRELKQKWMEQIEAQKAQQQQALPAPQN